MILAATAVGCQTAPPTVANRTLVAHLPGIDFSGLTSMRTIDSVKVRCSLPSKWIPLRLDKNPLYADQQWKSPSSRTGAGVMYIHLPFPMKATTLLWFAKLEYSKKSTADGHALAEWTDELGRPWFEAENARYHVRGYAVTAGCDAWIVYCGYKLYRPMSPSELSLAARCIDTVVPQVTPEASPSDASVADATERR